MNAQDQINRLKELNKQLVSTLKSCEDYVRSVENFNDEAEELFNEIKETLKECEA